MPSAANLMAAILMALVALIVSTMIPPLMPEGTAYGYFFHVNALIGALVGWFTVGTRSGRGWVSGVNAGLTGSAMLVVWGLLVQATNEMTRLALRRRYDDAFEAVISIFQMGAEWGILMFTTPIVITLVVGGAFTGLMTEMAARRWR